MSRVSFGFSATFLAHIFVQKTSYLTLKITSSLSSL